MLKCSVQNHLLEDIWTPVEDEMLRLIPEPTNSVDRNAVAVMKEGQIVGHVPFNLSPIISLFLRRDVNKAFARESQSRSWIWA